MKLHLVCPVFLAVTALVLTGCRTPHKTTHLSNGYEEVVYKSRQLLETDEPLPDRISFQYKSPEGKLTHIWPSLYGSSEVIHDHTAIFVGDEIYSDNGTATPRPRLFAVNAPALPLDITDEILAHWAKDSGHDFQKTEQLFNGVTPEAGNNVLLLHLNFLSQDNLVAERNFPDQSDFQLRWDQVAKIMDTVKTKGVYKEDPGLHSSYIGTKF